MATIAVTPVYGHEKKASSDDDSIIDEKLRMNETGIDADANSEEINHELKAAALTEDVGEVYDNVRAIDLGADGKERPIGKCHVYSFADMV